MDARIAKSLGAVRSLSELTDFEQNVTRLGGLTDEVRTAIRAKASDLGRLLVAEKTGLDLSNLSPAEDKIIRAVGEYAGIQKRRGLPTTRTFAQFKNRGLLAAAEISVMKSKPTQGFETLSEADLTELSYEKIIFEHPEEFSSRAQWFARRALNFPNDSAFPPAPGTGQTQQQTEKLVAWWRSMAVANGGYLGGFTNAQAALTIGISDMQRSGRAFGNIQSRIDYACYVLGLPPLGLTADEPFDAAWSQGDRDWTFPIESMRIAARQRQWNAHDFEQIVEEARKLPGQAHLSWKRELRSSPEKVRIWAFKFGGANTDNDTPTLPPPSSKQTSRNSPWTRDELILALDLYLRHRFALPPSNSKEVLELSKLLGSLANNRGIKQAGTFRNSNGVYMKLMNFCRLDPNYIAKGKTGLPRGGKLEEIIWNEFAEKPEFLAAAVASILATIQARDNQRVPYWVFVCNPKKWAIDQFLEGGITHDTWGVRPSDRNSFAPGQLGIVRVGVDRRSAAKRDGKRPLEAGIYALCEIESEVFEGTGANEAFWAEGSGRKPGWPTVRIRYLRTYLRAPLTIARLRAEAADISPLLLDGFEAASFSISADDFRAVVELLGENLDEVVSTTNNSAAPDEEPTALQNMYLHASPEVKERVSRYIERGNLGKRLKKRLGFKCQVCEALGHSPFSFKKTGGEPYAEAHHVMPVSALQAGSLAASNIMVLCANHHRQMHYGEVEVRFNEASFDLKIDGMPITIQRCFDID